MPINTKHTQYKNFEFIWEKCNIISQSEDEVKKNTTTYLPKLNGQTKEDYLGYLERAYFYAATGRTVEGLVGVAFRKDITWDSTLTEKWKAFTSKVTVSKQDFQTYAKQVFNRVVVTGRYGVLLEIVENASINTLPYFAGYSALSIINWRTTLNSEGNEIPTLVVLEEKHNEVDGMDIYTVKEVTKWRVLLLEDGKYIQRLYRKKENEKKDEFIQIGKDIIPMINGKSLDYIPFVIFGPDKPTFNCELPPILDIVNVNISHFKSAADLEHGRHFVAIPTPWVAGFTNKETNVLYMGSPYAWVSENPDAKAGMLEFTGQGLAALEKALEQKEQQMAILGARMLEQPKLAVEATDTHRIRVSGEQSVLASLAGAIEMGFNMLLGMAAKWINQSEIKCVFNQDYDVRVIDANLLNTLFAALQGGRISFDTWYYNLQRGELIPEGVTKEDELRLIEQTAPANLLGSDLTMQGGEDSINDNNDNNDSRIDSME